MIICCRRKKIKEPGAYDNDFNVAKIVSYLQKLVSGDTIIARFQKSKHQWSFYQEALLLFAMHSSLKINSNLPNQKTNLLIITSNSIVDFLFALWNLNL